MTEIPGISWRYLYSLNIGFSPWLYAQHFLSEPQMDLRISGELHLRIKGDLVMVPILASCTLQTTEHWQGVEMVSPSSKPGDTKKWATCSYSMVL